MPYDFLQRKIAVIPIQNHTEKYSSLCINPAGKPMMIKIRLSADMVMHINVNRARFGHFSLMDFAMKYIAGICTNIVGSDGRVCARKLTSAG